MGPFVVMGVSGCGKSTVARNLALSTGGIFLDADDFHPPENRARMASGLPLRDEEREGWLRDLNRTMRLQECLPEGDPRLLFLACSALKRTHRAMLSEGLETLRFIYLKGPPTLIRERLEQRTGHFMPASLLESQFQALEEPGSDEPALTVDITRSLAEIVSDLLPPDRISFRIF